MSNLVETINDALKESMKAKDEVRTRVIRGIKAELVKEQMLPRNAGKILDTQAQVQVLRKVVKRHEDSIEQFTAGNREDLVTAEKAELEVVKTFLPADLSDTDLDKFVEQAITELGITSKKETSKVVKRVVELTEGRAEGKVIFAKVSAKLT